MCLKIEIFRMYKILEINFVLISTNKVPKTNWIRDKNNLKLILRSLDKNLVIFYYLFLAVILFHENELKLIRTRFIFRILHI